MLDPHIRFKSQEEEHRTKVRGMKRSGIAQCVHANTKIWKGRMIHMCWIPAGRLGLRNELDEAKAREEAEDNSEEKPSTKEPKLARTGTPLGLNRSCP